MTSSDGRHRVGSPEAIAALIEDTSSVEARWSDTYGFAPHVDLSADAARVLRALVAALRAGDQKALTELGKPARKYLARRRGDAEKRWAELTAAIEPSDWHAWNNLVETHPGDVPWRFDDPVSARHEELLRLRDFFQGWLRNATPREMAEHFGSTLLPPSRCPILRAICTACGVPERLSQEHLDALERVFDRLRSGSENDPEAYVRAALRAINVGTTTWRKDLFAFEDRRSER